MQEGLDAFAVRAPQAVLVDLGLPDGEGFDVVGRIRENSEVPIVVISERGDELDPVRALEGGANDYLTKPFREAELFARLRVALKGATRAARHANTFTLGSLRIQRFDQRVFLNNFEVDLTPTEFKLLNALARDAGRVVGYRQILRQVWGPACIDDMQSLRVFVKQLRQKLEPDPSEPRLILTTPGVGYRLKPPEPVPMRVAEPLLTRAG
jgi:two-component system KDP operon response regulator KdpE